MLIYRWFQRRPSEYNTPHLTRKARGGAKLGTISSQEDNSWKGVSESNMSIDVLRTSKFTDITDVLSLIRNFRASSSTRLATLAVEAVSPELVSFPYRLWRKARYNEGHCSCSGGEQWRMKCMVVKIFYLDKLYRPFHADDIPGPVTTHIKKPQWSGDGQ